MSKTKSKSDTTIKKAMNDLWTLVKQQQRFTETKNPEDGKMMTIERPDTLAELRKDLAALQKPLNKVIAEQKALPSVNASFSSKPQAERFQDFEAWMKKHAPDSLLGEKFEFALNVAEGVGVKALTDMKQGDLFITIPRNIAMSTDTLLASPVGNIVQTDDTCLRMPSLALAVHLLFERLNPDSFFTPYLDVLAKQGELEMPVDFDDKTLNLLQGSSVLVDTLKLRKTNIRQYVHLWRLFKRSGFMHKVPSFNYVDFCWAVSIVMTRQNAIPTKENADQTQIALLPGFDFLNYRPGPNMTAYDTEHDRLEVTAMKDTQAGDGLYIYYGERSNGKLFLFNGFVVDEHERDSIEVVLKVDDADPLARIRTMLLMKAGFNPEQGFTYPAVDAAGWNQILHFCRMCVVNKEEAGMCLKNASLLKAQSEPLNNRNEREALAFFIQNLQRILSGYISTYEADAALLNKGGLSFAENLCIRLRRSEQLQLIQASMVLDERLTEMNAIDHVETKQ